MTQEGRRGAVLVLRALGLGDLLAAVPALRALRRWTDAAHPGAALVLACPAGFAPLLGLRAGAPYDGRRPLVDRVLDLVAKDVTRLEALPDLWRRSSPEPPLVAVNLHGSGPASHRALAALDPGRLVAFASAEDGAAGPPWVSPHDSEEHEAARWCRLVRDTLGVPADSSDLRLDPPRSSPPPAPGAVVVHAGAAYPSRCWPPDRWAAVARALAGDSHRVVLTGSPDEAALAVDVARRAGLSDEAVLAGRTDLGELAALVAGAPLVLCGDTGVAHLASAYGTPSVVLFGPTSPARWGPPAAGPHTVLWHGSEVGEGDPHGATPDPTLLRVTVDEVVAAARARVTGGPGPGPSSPTSELP